MKNNSLSIVLADDLSEVPRSRSESEILQEWQLPKRLVGRSIGARRNAHQRDQLRVFRWRHEIEVRIEFRDGVLSASVSDDGDPFDPLRSRRPIPWSAEIGGSAGWACIS